MRHFLFASTSLVLFVAGCSGGTSQPASTTAPGAAGAAGAGAGQGGSSAAGTGGAGEAAGASAAGTGGAAGSAGGSGVAGAGAAGAPGAPCMGTTSSTLPGVALEFPSDVKCIYTVTEVSGGIKIPYRLTIDPALAGTVVKNDSQASCETPGASGLFVFERLAGGAESYCICDGGLCAQPSMTPLAPGAYPMAFGWDGKNWSGPSDTGNPKGAPFPQGTYTLTVRAAGSVLATGAPFVVTATLQILLVGKCGPCASEPIAGDEGASLAR